MGVSMRIAIWVPIWAGGRGSSPEKPSALAQSLMFGQSPADTISSGQSR